MKRVVIFILFVLVFLGSIGIGYFYLNTRSDQKKTSEVEENFVISNNSEEEYVSTEMQEEKISPNAALLETTYYLKCGHTVTEEVELPEDAINLNEEEFEEKYDDWKVNYFSDLEIAIYQEVDGTCPEHYIVGSNNGVINIYRLNESGEEELYEVTNIFIEYLPEKDQEQLADTIEVIGSENLNSLLENYE